LPRRDKSSIDKLFVPETSILARSIVFPSLEKLLIVSKLAFSIGVDRNDLASEIGAVKQNKLAIVIILKSDRYQNIY
jgi:hypothetical protein